MKIIKKSDGFTLIELLIGMTMMIILLGIAFQVLNTSIKAYQTNMAIANNKLIIRSAMNIITDELRYASAVTNPVFVANVPTASPPSTINYTLNNHQCSITLDSKTKTITIVSDASTYQIASGTVMSLGFARSGTHVNEVIVSITVNDNSFTGSPSTSLDTIVITSNLQ